MNLDASLTTEPPKEEPTSMNGMNLDIPEPTEPPEEKATSINTETNMNGMNNTL